MGHFYVDRLSPFLWETQILGHHFGIRWYGLSYLLSFFLVYWFFRRAALKQEIPGLDLPEVDNLTLRIIAGVMIGGRLGFVIQHLDKLFQHPLFLIAIWEGGMAFFGGLAGVIVAIFTFGRRYGMNFLALTDICAQPAALGLGIGRIANFANSELYGKPTGANWGVVFPNANLAHPDLLPRHPSQLYECVSHLLLFAILFFLYRRWVGTVRPGVISYIFLIGYGLFRLITDFWRQDDVYWGPLSDGQWFSLGIAVAGCIALYTLLRKGPPDSVDTTRVQIPKQDGVAPPEAATS